MSDFKGFSPDLQRFFRDLEANNTREWFEAHRADYDSLYVEDAKAFVAAMGPALRKVVPGISAEPRVNGSIMRINRDTRFAKDKRPYKTGLGLFFWEGASRKDSPAFVMWIGPDAVQIAAGLFGFMPAQLERYRAAVDDPKAGVALSKAIDKIRGQGPWDLGKPKYKRVPRGFAPDHPRGELLKHAGLHIGGAEPEPDALFGPGAVAHCVARYRTFRPVHKWLVDALTPD